jgi:hypothetical protein
MADALTLTITEVTPGQQLQTPWGAVQSAPTTTTKQIVLAPDQLTALKAALSAS